MQTTRRLPLLTRGLPRLFGRFVSESRGTKDSSVFSVIDCPECCSEAEDSGAAAPHLHQTQPLRAYLRNRRSHCLTRLRKEGLIPAVLVDGDKERRPNDGSTDVFISLDAKPLLALLKLIGKRGFVSRVFNMDIYRSASCSELQESLHVLPRNLNYGPEKTNVLNIQFIRAPAGEDLKLGIPLEFLGTHLCPGLKKGGTLKILAKYVVYKCNAKEVPAKIVVDVSVLEIGDQVQVQDLKVEFCRLISDRTMVVCEIVKDVRTLKAKARRMKNKLLCKKRALARKESNEVLAKEDSKRRRSLSDDEIDVSDDGEDEVVPYRYQKQRAFARKGDVSRKASTKNVFGESHDDILRPSRPLSDSAKEQISRFVSGKRQNPSKQSVTCISSVSSRTNKGCDAIGHNVCHQIVKKNKVIRNMESDGDETLPRLARERPGPSKKWSFGQRPGHREELGAEAKDEDVVLQSYDLKVDGKALPSYVKRKTRTPKSEW